MEFLIQNYDTILLVITGILTVAGFLVKFTKTKKDDEILEIIKKGFDFAKNKVTKEDLIAVEKKIETLKKTVTSIKEKKEVEQVEVEVKKLKEVIK